MSAFMMSLYMIHIVCLQHTSVIHLILIMRTIPNRLSLNSTLFTIYCAISGFYHLIQCGMSRRLAGKLSVSLIFTMYCSSSLGQCRIPIMDFAIYRGWTINYILFFSLVPMVTINAACYNCPCFTLVTNIMKSNE